MHYEDLIANIEQGILKTLKNYEDRINEKLIEAILCVQNVDLINISSE